MAKLVKVHTLETENDFFDADEMLSLSDYTEDYESEDYYKERSAEAMKFVGTYEIEIDREADFYQFRDVCYQSIQAHKTDEYWLADRGSAERTAIFEEREKMNVFYKSITFENWKDGKTDKGMKLGKKLQKEGFPQAVLDFYGTQIKSEKVVYFTLSDRVHDVIGMSNYAEEDSWDGYEGTSCQDTRHNCSYNFNLLGAIGDGDLLIGQLHYKLEDVEDMQDNLKARVLMRRWEVSYNQKKYNICKGVKLYGNNTTKSELRAVIECLRDEGLGITLTD